MLLMLISLIPLPEANAHDPTWTVPTWCYVNLAPNLVGVDQETLVAYWANAYPPTAIGRYGDRWTFTLNVTKPNGDNEILGPYTSDPIGGGFITFKPDQVGTYTFIAHMDKHVITGTPMNPTLTAAQQQGAAYVNDTYAASDSDPAYLTVQEDPIASWPEAPLPTDFWTRPINSANRAWAPLASNWLAGAAQNVGPTTNFGYGTGPESAHVMWAKPYWAGGIMDARFGDYGYSSQNYEGLSLVPPIILNGKIYYRVTSVPREGWYCVDLYTGETDYFYNTTGPVTGVSQSSSGAITQQSIAFGQLYKRDDPNQHGGFPYLWSTTGPTANTWMMYDAFTGNYICSIANVSAGGTAVYGKDGSMLRYSIVTQGKPAQSYLQVWNTTQAIWWKPTFTSNYYWYWRPGVNETYDGRNGFSLNVTIPAVQGTIRAVREDQYVIGGTTGVNNENGITPGNLWALNLDPAKGEIGALLWNRTFTPPSSAGNTTLTMGQVDPEDGVFLFREQQGRKNWAYDLETMKQLWESESEPQMNFYLYSQNNIYQGKLFTYNYAGVIFAYDIRSGDILWNYTAPGVGFESPYGNYPLYLGCIADGKLYMYSSEHSPTIPLFRGAYVRCINASNGVELWKFLDWEAASSPALGGGIGNTAIADGFLLSLNAYDNRIYCFGKGPSATEVTASPKITVDGGSIMIEGKVTDQSAGAKDTPAIADENMEAWMEYLYEQQAKPTNASGVTISLDTIDPNNNYVHIGTVKSDMDGMFKKMWTPEVPGEYTVIATFKGSEAYWGSNAETAVGVSEPIATATTQTTEVTSLTDLYFIPAIIGVIIAIAMVGIIIVLMLRKRP